ncbi:MAG: hypothetical protein Q4Q04_05605 [Methanocorpusculum sp.]|nr:hypothetical protein [Methanocorpusculum sp.]
MENAVSPAVAVVLLVALSVVLVAGVSAVLIGMTSGAADTSMSFNMTESLLQKDMGWVVGIFPEGDSQATINITNILKDDRNICIKNEGTDIICSDKILKVYINSNQLIFDTKIGKLVTSDNPIDYQLKINKYNEQTNTWHQNTDAHLILKQGMFYSGTHIRVDLVDNTTGKVLSRSEYTCP